MKLSKSQSAPSFTASDVWGNPVSLSSYKGKKVFLGFMRFAGCPVCNLRVHELLKKSETFKSKNIEVVLVYESSPTVMLDYLEGEKYPFTFIADPENKLYDLYSVEVSWGKFLSSLFKGLMQKAGAGQKLFRKKITKDGKLNRIGAEFLINEQGTLEIAHYASFLGDEVAIDALLK
jgi:peroxiredoxin Q/BCP